MSEAFLAVQSLAIMEIKYLLAREDPICKPKP